MLDIHELTVFLAAAESENFSAAARQLNLTQPAVSMQIKSLEKKLNIKLFHRSGRKLALSESGKALMPMARDIIQRSKQIQEEIEAMKGEVVGRLKVGCSTTTGKYFLPNLVARFRSRFPKVQVNIYNRSREMVIENLCDGEVHFSVISAKPECGDVEYRQFFEDDVIFVVPTSHQWATRRELAPPELLDANFIMRGPSSGTREEVVNALSQVGLNFDDLSIVMEIGNSEAIAMAVEEGIGVAFVSRTVVRRPIDEGRLIAIPVAGFSLKRQIYISFSQRYPATRAQTEFWQFIQEQDIQDYLSSVATA